MKRSTLMMTALVLMLALVVALPACAQPGGQGGFGGGGQGGPGMGGPGGGMGMRPMGPPPGMTGPTVTMIVSDGVIYVACEGKLTAYEAKTLKQLAQVTFWTAPTPPPGGGMGPGGQQPAGPPPAAP